MQGLVQAMQTQAQTQAALQAQLQAQLAVKSGVEAEELEVPLSVHTPEGETVDPVLEEDIVRSDSEREE
ncbi:hypothetical protein Taro_013719 [Colocasia esculenta]|uniref:Uncharacterized protein n=1 Tax=Colocasia esculenta TaxID=4460 RepID=A0A843UCP0_COLES|nr:hypothetical protein [Colocasia esculenta]